MQERRKNKRLELESKIIIKSLNDPEVQHETVIDIVDVSKTGVGFNCDLPLTIGTVGLSDDLDERSASHLYRDCAY